MVKTNRYEAKKAQQPDIIATIVLAIRVITRYIKTEVV